MKRLRYAPFALLLSSGCFVTEFGNPGSCDGLGGEEDCRITSSRAIEWAEAGPFGVSPESAFSEVEGSCRAPFAWEGNDWSELSVDPVSGQSVIDVTVSIDRQSAILVEREVEKGACGPGFCPSYLEVSGQVNLKTADGTLDEREQVTINYMDSSSYGLPTSPPTVRWSRAPDELNGTLSIRSSRKNTSVRLSFEIMPVQKDCAGRVLLGSETCDGKECKGGGGIFATWSISGCEFGTRGVDLGEPYQGLLLTDEIAALWNDATYRGRWDDGEATLFHLAVTTSTPTACVETHDKWSVVSIPVEVSYYTDDGRLTGIAGTGNVRATIRNDQRLLQFDLWMSEEMQCEPFFDLSYCSADCSQIHHVTAQLGINHYFDGAESAASSGGRIELYISELADDGVNPRHDYKSDLVTRLALMPL